MIKKSCTFLLVVLSLFLIGCISTSSSTGASTEAGTKTQQQAQQKTGQEASSKDTTKLQIDRTDVYITDTEGKTLMHISVGGGRAETGSVSFQSVDTSVFQKQVAEASATASAEAVSKAKASLMPLVLLVIGILILLSIFSVGSRTLPPAVKCIKKFLAP